MELKVDSAYGRQAQQSSTHIDLGLIDSINSELNTMNVILPYLDNQKVNDITINQSISASGYGIKFMPIPGTTYVFLHSSSNTPDRYVHLGYYIPDNSSISDNSSGTKKGDIIYQRYLEGGEIQLISKSNAEIFLDNRGSILLKSNSGYFVSLSDYDGGIKCSVEDAEITTSDTKLALGRVKRRNIPASCIPQVIRDSNSLPYSEHRVDIGIQYDEQGVPVVSADSDYPNIKTNPTVGSITFSQVVHDIHGAPERMLPSEVDDVQWLINLASGIKIGIDTLGTFWIVNAASGGYIKYSPSQSKEGDLIKDTSSFEIKIAKSNFSLSQFGEFLYTNEYVKDPDNAKVELSINKSGDFKAQVSPDGGTATNTILMNKTELSITSDDGTIKNTLLQNKDEFSITNDDGSTKNKVKLSADGVIISNNGGATEEKTLLGEKTQTLLNSLLTALISHNHGTPIGPTTPPLNAPAFTQIQTVDLLQILSLKTKNN